MKITDTESDGLFRKTVLTVVTMLGGVVMILGTASLIALFVTTKAVGASAPTAQATSEDVKVGAQGKDSKSPSSFQMARPPRGNANNESAKQPGNEI